MEDHWEQKDAKVEEEEPLLESAREKGGFRTLPFIMGFMFLEGLAANGLSPNMSLYLINEYHMAATTASNVLFMWSAASNFMPLIGAVIADSYLGRFHTVGFGSIICLMGIIFLWSTTMIPQAIPPPCDQSSNICSAPTTLQSLYLFLSLGLISTGGGAVASSSVVFGADQLENKCFKEDPSMKQRYFSWYYATTIISVLVASTCIVYIQDNLGWRIGFTVPAVLMLVGVIVFYLASPFYVKFKSSSSLIIGLVQVAVASYRNRHLKLSDSRNNLYHVKNGSGPMIPSENLRFLNKACIVRDAEKELIRDGRAVSPWRLCSVEQVEALKALLRIVPIWCSGTIMSINLNMGSFPVLQASSMDRHIGSNFEIPAASFGIFMVVSIMLWIVLYGNVFLPLASRLMGRPVRLSSKQRMGLGIFLSFLGMIVSAMVEAIRRSIAIKQGYLNQSQDVVGMSALWVIPQHLLVGFAEGSNAVAQLEFYYSELAGSMPSIASAIIAVGMSVANLLASSIMNTVDYLSQQGGKESWISSDINKGHYDYYYLVLAGVSMANMFYFLVVSAAFGPLREEKEDGNVCVQEEEDDEL